MKQLVFALILGLVAVNSFAASTCNTLAECRALKIQVDELKMRVDQKVEDLQPIPQFGDIERNADGSIRYMSFYEAIRYCKDPKYVQQPAHLPTAKEFAHLASRKCTTDIIGNEPCGASGVSVTPKDGFQFVRAINYAGEGDTDTFYFSNTGYNFPAGKLWKYKFRASSDSGPAAGIDFNGFSGELTGDFGICPSDDCAIAVRCARGQ